MENSNKENRNIKQAVPTNMKESLGFYLRVLGFELKSSWPDDDNIRWCYIENGGAAIMLQENVPYKYDERMGQGTFGYGLSICSFCEDALQIYHEITSRGAVASEPFVSNGLLNTEVKDPDGYRLEFESYTKVAEGTRYSAWKR